MSWTIATPDGAAVHEDGQLRFVDSPDQAQPAGGRCARAALARVLPQHLQCGAHQSRGHAARDATALLEESSRSGGDCPADARRRSALCPAPTREGRQPRIDAACRRIGASAIAAACEGPAACRRCDIWRHATQAVTGEGPKDAAIMLVGEQPGDEEDLRGRPFVGPAGQILDNALQRPACRASRSSSPIPSSISNGSRAASGACTSARMLRRYPPVASGWMLRSGMSPHASSLHWERPRCARFWASPILWRPFAARNMGHSQRRTSPLHVSSVRNPPCAGRRGRYAAALSCGRSETRSTGCEWRRWGNLARLSSVPCT